MCKGLEVIIPPKIYDIFSGNFSLFKTKTLRVVNSSKKF
jgi:hypothetical protein